MSLSHPSPAGPSSASSSSSSPSSSIPTLSAPPPARVAVAHPLLSSSSPYPSESTAARRPLTNPTSSTDMITTATSPPLPPFSSSSSSPPLFSSASSSSRPGPASASSNRNMSIDQGEALQAPPKSSPLDKDDDQSMKSPTMVLADRRAKRASSGSHPPHHIAAAGRDDTVTVASCSSSSSKQLRRSRTALNDIQPTGMDSEDHAGHGRSTERATVLQDVQKARLGRSHRSRPSTSSHSSHEDRRSRTPSPILGDAYAYAGASTRPGHTGAPMVGPSAADLQAILYDRTEGRNRTSAVRPDGLPETGEITAMISRVEEMAMKDGRDDLAGAEGTSSSASREAELIQMVKKLGQHALEQDAYLLKMEESLHNTRVTAVSVVSSLTAQHAYELSQEKQLRDRLEIELDGVQTSAKKLSSLLAKSQSRNEDNDRERAASVEEEMKWLASLPGGAAKRPSLSATATANAAMSPRQPGGSRLADPFVGVEAGKSNDLAGLGISETPVLHHSEYVDVFDSPMSAMISERNKLAADKKHLKNRVRDAEAQLHRLENELKALRPLLLQGVVAKAYAASSGTTSFPATPSSSQRTPGKARKDPGSARRRRANVMGDAEAEHLLLAARRLNHARAQVEASMPPFSETSPLKPSSTRFSAMLDRPSTPPSRLTVPPRTPGTAATITARTPRSTGKHRVSILDSMLSNGGPPALAGSPQSRSKPVFRNHERLDSTASNASFSGIDELLQAAQSVSTPRDQRLGNLGEAAAEVNSGVNSTDAYFQRLPQTSNDVPSTRRTGVAPALASAIALERSQTHDSPKRRRMSAHVADQDRLRFMSSSPQQQYLDSLRTTDGGVVNGNGSRRLRTRTEGANQPLKVSTHRHRGGSGDGDGEGAGISALDLLADQATASQNPSSSSEPSNSDGEKKGDGYSSQGETAVLRVGKDDDTNDAFLSKNGPKHVASSLMAARARVAGSGVSIAYAHSPGSHSDYAGSGPNGPLPRFSTGYPPSSPLGAGGAHLSQLSSPLTPTYSGPLLPPPPSGLGGGGGPDAYHLRGINSSGPVGSIYSGHNSSLPHLNTSAGHHGGHAHQSSYSPYGQQMLPPLPMSPHSHSMPPHLQLQHSHHHSGGSLPANGSSLPPPPSAPTGYMMSASPSPVSATAPHHHYAYHPQHQQQQQHGQSGQQQPQPPPQPSLRSPHAANNGHRASLSQDLSKTPRPKGGNTSPDKRLPYVRWTSEEDTKLRQAIAHHGQRWEAVAKAVGTRSYHQCRQRALLMRRKGLDPVVGGGGGSGGHGGRSNSRGGSGSSGGGGSVGRGAGRQEGDSATPDGEGDGDEADELGEGEEEGDEGDDYGNEMMDGASSAAEEQQQTQDSQSTRHAQQVQDQHYHQVDPRLE